jgi:hypothetical protein
MRISLLSTLSIGLTFVPAWIASAQDAAPVPKAPVQTPDPVSSLPPAKVEIDLIHRFRFSEQYTNRDVPGDPQLIGPYTVTSKETVTDTLESPDGPASKPTEQVRESVYAERPAEVSGLGLATATLRTYQKYGATPQDPTRPAGQPLFEGLPVGYRPQSNLPPQILRLEAGMPLRERDYEIASRQVYVPGLTGLLPTVPVRVGDSWRIPRKAVQAMLGEPGLQGDAVTGKFTETRTETEGGMQQAVLAINGRIENGQAETRVKAEVIFRFAKPVPRPNRPTPGAESAARPSDESLVDARGAIVALRLARVATGVISRPSAKPQKFRAGQELVLDRKIGPTSAAGLRLIPDPYPKPTDANSLLIYSDPKKSFTFLHPQDLLPPERHQFNVAQGPATVYLIRTRPEGRDMISLYVFPLVKGPEALKELLSNQWKLAGAEVLNGDESWLKEMEKPDRKVFHLEAALKVPGKGSRAPRIHYDAYLVQLGKDLSLMAVATTTRDSVPAFRREVEKIVDSFRPGKDATN